MIAVPIMPTPSRTEALPPQVPGTQNIILSHSMTPEARNNLIENLTQSASSLKTLTLDLQTQTLFIDQVLKHFITLERLTTLRLVFFDPASSYGFYALGRAVGELKSLRVLELRNDKTPGDLTRVFMSLLECPWGGKLEDLALICRPRTLQGFHAALQFTSVHRRLRKLTLDIDGTAIAKKQVHCEHLRTVVDMYFTKEVLSTVVDLTFSVRIEADSFTPPLQHCTSLTKANFHRLTQTCGVLQFSNDAFGFLTSVAFKFTTPVSVYIILNSLTLLHLCPILQTFHLVCPSYIREDNSQYKREKLAQFIATIDARPNLTTLIIAIPIPENFLLPIAEFAARCKSITTLILGLDRERDPNPPLQLPPDLRHAITSVIQSPIKLQLPFQPDWRYLNFAQLKHLHIAVPDAVTMMGLSTSSLIERWGTSTLDVLHLDLVFSETFSDETVTRFVLMLVMHTYAVRTLRLHVTKFEVLRPCYPHVVRVKSNVGVLEISGSEKSGEEERRFVDEAKRIGEVPVRVIDQPDV
ncbi:hypothetical protein BC829DRAFT_401656 [Chytridium lagenaria]|nr:hypothetical protein BC829DRAFT_401656 [Chytridium lagenaria]